MKFVHFFVFLSALFTTIHLSAQHESAKVALVAKINFIDNLTPLDGGFTLFDKDNFSETTTGGEVGFFFNINKFMNVGIPLRFSRNTIYPTGVRDEFRSKSGLSADVNLQLGYFKSNYIFTPYIMGGAGYQSEFATNNYEDYVAFPVGAGFNLRLAPSAYIQIQTEYRFTTVDFREQLLYSGGIVFALSPPARPPKPKDTDKDGVDDSIDECPTRRGTPETNGCPDRDGDGIPNRKDDCPRKAGLAKFGGCPDTDMDGVADPSDECPETPGPVERKGCPLPDGDQDGVPDEQDECPEEAGVAANNGCPEIVPEEEEVPIPDTDNDGVNDIEDPCPDEAGTISNKGCPEIEKEDKEILSLAVDNIEFNFASATLKTISFPTLDQIADLMQKYPAYQLAISGHADNTGTAAANQVISERRAEACYQYLIQKGVSAARMNFTGYGETQPIADNATEAGRERNRRVTFSLYVE